MNEIEKSQREAVIAEAVTWLRTPYHHKGRVKGHGVDCAYLLAEVYHAVGLIPYVPDIDYSPDWMMHQSEERYLGVVEEHGIEVEMPQPGDVVMYKVGHCWAHGGIVVDWPLIIHASLRDGVVGYGEGDQGWLSGRKRKYFTLWR